MPTVTTPKQFTEIIPDPVFPAPHGLFSVAQTPTPSDNRWVNGIEWEHAACAAVSGISGTCAEPVGLPKVIRNSRGFSEADPFTLYGSHTCSPVGSSPDAAMQFATDNLLRHQQEGAEQAISSDDFGASPTFLGATDLTPAGAASGVGIPYALGLLAAHAASVYGLEASVIHAPRLLSGFLAATEATTAGPADSIATVTGELVSLGGGYANLDPAGDPAADGSAWLYVTPPVTMLMSRVITSPPQSQPYATLNLATNEQVSVAERVFLFAWEDCPLGAVQVDLNNPY